MQFENSLEYAQRLDQQDKLSKFRSQFHIPASRDGKELIYLCGNSLGLQPKTTEKYIQEELHDWASLGVKGHMEAKRPWVDYHHFTQEKLAKVVGAKREEVVAMNALTVNLHLLMVSFYRPEDKRFKIVVESDLFPSDHYAVESQIKFHGYDAKEGIIELKPREGKHHLRTDDILSTIQQHGDEIALVMLGGVNYYTGQYFDIPAITKAAHDVGALAGWDLAHAAGNVPLQLHDWDVDFAAWCSYKYLNSGPGGVSGIFVHEKHGNKPDLPRFAGWWGYNEKTRFEMHKGFVPMPGATGWQMSNVPILSSAAHLASLDIFDEAGMDSLREKSLRLTGYLEYLLNELNDDSLKIITPSNPNQRGCQLSILTGENGKELFNYISNNSIVADWRHPNVIRIAPTPLYNTFEEVYHFCSIVKQALEQ